MGDRNKFATCIWLSHLSGKHGGKIKERELFKGRVVVQACDNHYKEHLMIMGLVDAGFTHKKIFAKNNDYKWLKQEYIKLQKKKALKKVVKKV